MHRLEAVLLLLLGGDVQDKPIFSTVATSGSYTDLLNKPTIPTNNNQLANGAGYITGVNLDMWNAAASSVGNKTIGNSNNGNYIDIIEDLRVKAKLYIQQKHLK